MYKNKVAKAMCGNSKGISLLAVAGMVLAYVALQMLTSDITELMLPDASDADQ